MCKDLIPDKFKEDIENDKEIVDTITSAYTNLATLEVRGANAPLLLAPAEGFEDS